MQITELIQAYKALQETTPKYSTYPHISELNVISDILLSMINDCVVVEFKNDDDNCIGDEV